LAAVEPIEAARRCQKAIADMNSGFHEERRRRIAEAYAVARALQNNPRAWENFRKDDFWQQRKKKPSIEDRKAPLLPVMVFVFNAIDRNRYKSASKYAAALQQYLTHDVPAQEVAAKIKKAGGIEKLYRDSAANKPKKKPKPEQSLKLLPGSDALRKKILAVPKGQKAQLIIKRVDSEQGVVAIITGFHPGQPDALGGALMRGHRSDERPMPIPPDFAKRRSRRLRRKALTKS
jgi:hypothetical protein